MKNKIKITVQDGETVKTVEGDLVSAQMFTYTEDGTEIKFITSGLIELEKFPSIISGMIDAIVDIVDDLEDDQLGEAVLTFAIGKLQNHIKELDPPEKKGDASVLFCGTAQDLLNRIFGND